MSAAAGIVLVVALVALVLAFDRPVTARPARTAAALLGGALAVGLLASLRLPAIDDHAVAFAGLLLGAAIGGLLLRRPPVVHLRVALAVALPGVGGLAAALAAFGLLLGSPLASLPAFGLVVAILSGLAAALFAWRDRPAASASPHAIALAGIAVAGLGVGVAHLFVVAAGTLAAAAATTVALRSRG